MALPHTPKTDWAAADGVTETNLNEIGENLEHLDNQNVRRRFHLSGSLFVTQSFTDDEVLGVISLSVRLFASTRLMLRGIRYFTGSTSAPKEFEVQVVPHAFPVAGIGDDISGLVTYTSANAGYSDIIADHQLCQNITAATDYVLIVVAYANRTGGTTAIGINGVDLNFEIQDL